MLENLESSLLDTTTSYAPGIILIFSTLKLNIKFLVVSSKLLSRFSNTNHDLKYYIALEPDSTFN